MCTIIWHHFLQCAERGHKTDPPDRESVESEARKRAAVSITANRSRGVSRMIVRTADESDWVIVWIRTESEAPQDSNTDGAFVKVDEEGYKKANIPRGPRGLPTNRINTCTASALSLAKQWIEECDTSHSRCNSTSPNMLPTRLLEVTREKDRPTYDTSVVQVRLPQLLLGREGGLEANSVDLRAPSHGIQRVVVKAGHSPCLRLAGVGGVRRLWREKRSFFSAQNPL